MSVTNTYSILCPKCEASLSAELYDSINVGDAPALRDQLMANELNAVTCPHCDFVFRVDKQLLYNDPTRRFMVFWFPGSEAQYQSNKEEFITSMTALNQTLPDDFDPPGIHLVFSRTELVERIFLLEAGLNERIIEYVKYMMYSRNQEKCDPQKKAILFNAEDSTDEALCFVVQDVETLRLESMMEFDRSAYDGLLELFDNDEKTANLMELFPGPYISARALFLHEAAADE